MLREPEERLLCMTQAPRPESKQGASLESGTCPFRSSSGAKLWDPWTPCGSLEVFDFNPFSIDAKHPAPPPFVLWDRGPPSSAVQSSMETDFCPPGSGSRGSGDDQLLRPCLTPLSQRQKLEPLPALIRGSECLCFHPLSGRHGIIISMGS